MKKSKIVFLLLVAYCLNYHFSLAQVVYAGPVIGGFYDINPDQLVNAPPIQTGLPNSIYTINMFEGAEPDFEFRGFGYMSGGATESHISIIALNPNCSVLFSRIDTPSVNRKVAKPLLFGDSINAAHAIWEKTIMYLYSLLSVAGMPGISGSITDWNGNIDHYVGVRYESTADTLYGWIRVRCSASTSTNPICYIKDYSSLTLGANKNVKKDELRFFPNPIKDRITFHIVNGENITHFRIINNMGLVMLDEKVAKTSFLEKNLSSLPDGIYFIQLQVNASLLTRKIVIQH